MTEGDDTTRVVLIAYPGDRRVGEVKADGDGYLVLPIGGSVWTRHATIEAAFEHCLDFVGWADRGGAT